MKSGEIEKRGEERGCEHYWLLKMAFSVGGETRCNCLFFLHED